MPSGPPPPWHNLLYFEFVFFSHGSKKVWSIWGSEQGKGSIKCFNISSESFGFMWAKRSFQNGNATVGHGMRATSESHAGVLPCGCVQCPVVGRHSSHAGWLLHTNAHSHTHLHTHSSTPNQQYPGVLHGNRQQWRSMTEFGITITLAKGTQKDWLLQWRTQIILTKKCFDSTVQVFYREAY